MIRPEEYEGLRETLEILADKIAVKRIRKSWLEARNGKTISLETLLYRLA